MFDKGLKNVLANYPRISEIVRSQNNFQKLILAEI